VAAGSLGAATVLRATPAWAAGYGSGGAAAAPGRNGGALNLVAAISYQGGSNFSGVQQQLVDDYIAAHFGAKHPGVRVTTIPGPSSNGNSSSTTALIAAAVAGSGPDIMEGGGWQLPEVLSANMLQPLNGFVSQANLNLSVFDPGHLAILNRPENGGLVGLPAYDGPMVLLVNYTMLDQLGVALPSPDWTYQQAERIWASVAGQRGGKQIYGAGLDDSDEGWLLSLWGGSYQSPDGLRCTADAPACVEAATWMRSLIAGKVVDGGGNGGSVRHGQAAFGMSGGWNVQHDMLTMEAQGVQWDWLPMPVFPRGKPATYNNGDWYGISAYSKAPAEVLWDLFYLIAIDAGFQQLMFRTTFVEPNQITLWPDWLELVRAVAPPLRNKHLEYYQQAMDYGVCNYRFPYEPAQCDNIISTYLGEIMSGKISPTLGLRLATQQINAIQSTGASVVAAVDRQQASIRATLAKAAAAPGALTSFPAPPQLGAGTPPHPAGSMVQVAPTGAVTVTGAGADVFLNNRGDNCTFAGSASTAVDGRFVCRLTSLANVNGPHLSQWAKAGLMARGDLSNNAAAIAIEVTGGNGVNLQYRVIPQVHTETVSAGSGKTGLIAASDLTLPFAKPAPNYLKQPVWLMLENKLNLWTAYTSLDGKNWTVAGPSVYIQMAGAWVGVFVTAHNESKGFKPGEEARAVFDKLSGLQPSQRVWLGVL
jgi:ABC-type glycerol-3-phosphate transport system substrate-binding protein